MATPSINVFFTLTYIPYSTLAENCEKKIYVTAAIAKTNYVKIEKFMASQHKHNSLCLALRQLKRALCALIYALIVRRRIKKIFSCSKKIVIRKNRNCKNNVFSIRTDKASKYVSALI